MGAVKPRSASLTRAFALVLAGLSLTACASVGPRYPLTNGGANPAAGGSQRPPPQAFAGKSGTNKPYEVAGRWYTPMEQPNYDEIGTASWYGQQFHNHYTADGEVFDMRMPSAAHKTLPLPCLVEVTNLANGRKLVVRVNDRGPFVDGRIIDMSREAAAELGFIGQGVAQVRVRYVGPAPANPGGVRLYQASDEFPLAPSPRAAKSKPPAQTKMARAEPAPGGALLGSDIDDRSIQASPSTVTWGVGAQIAKASEPAPATASLDTASGAPAPSDIDDLLSLSTDTSAPAVAVSTPRPMLSRSLVQVGAFASRANAERAAARLVGEAQIVPSQQAGHVLYKVMIGAPSGPVAPSTP